MSLVAGTLRRALERVVSNAFELDEDSRLALAGLEETYLVLAVGGPLGQQSVRTMVRIHNGVIELGRADAVLPDITISGSLPVVARYLAGWFQNVPRPADGVTLTGDVARLNRIVAICGGLDPDWEEPVSHLLGDIPARHLGSLARELRRWARTARERAHSATAEYIHYESGTVPSRKEWTAHVRDLSALHARLDQARARLQDDSGEHSGATLSSNTTRKTRPRATATGNKSDQGPAH